jgi:hypothetical protein
MLPLINVPVSRKVVAVFIVTVILALLRTVGVIEPPADWTAWIVTGGGLLAGAIVGEGTKYLNYAAERLGLPVRVTDRR